MKYYNTKLTPLAAVDLKQFLHNNKITFETSGCGDLVHFEILASPEQAQRINVFIDTLFI